MATDNGFTIRIESILGGHSDFQNFAGKDQFLASYAIDPDQPSSDSGNQSIKASGFLRPAGCRKIDHSTTLSGAPMWLIPNPKDDEVYVYAASGSVYSLDPNGYAITAVGDLNDGGTATGNGSEYYDNYIYFSRDTTVARYGPLNGTAAFTDDYWVSTLSKTALENTTYPELLATSRDLPNHVLHRHSDGKLYIADVVGNQGYLHYIATTKTTVEGDTDNSSTYGKLDFPYGYWPVDIETYGSDLAIALYEGSRDLTTIQKKAKLSFWDTTSANYNKIIDVEFPDPIITALDNVNGVLYTFSGQPGNLGTRVCRFVGGYSFEQIAFIEDSEPPFPGATTDLLNRILFAGSANYINNNSGNLASVWALGSKTGKYQGLHNVMGASNTTVSDTAITSMAVIDQDGFNFQIPVIGWATNSTYGIDRQTADYGRINPRFKSQVYRIGRPFKITKIRIPLATAVGSNMTLIPTIYVDEESTSYALQTINSTNYPNSDRQIILRSAANSRDITGKHSFYFELSWTGTSLLTVGLPIEIEGEYLND